MMDLVYIAATLLFFAAMLLYAVGCQRLGRTADVERTEESLP